MYVFSENNEHSPVKQYRLQKKYNTPIQILQFLCFIGSDIVVYCWCVFVQNKYLLYTHF